MRFTTERFIDVWDEIQPLLHAHWDAIAHKATSGALDIDYTAYVNIEKAGALHLTTARDAAGTLCGYAAYIISKNLHYKSILTADVDVFFLARAYRKGLAGVRLLQAAERSLLQRGVTHILQKVKVAHDCGKIFTRMGYDHVENVYIKAV